MNIEQLLERLIEKSADQRNQSILFEFMFRDTTRFKGVFFARSKTLTIAQQDENVGWQTDLSGGKLSKYIPNDAYVKISNLLKTSDNQKYSNDEFFDQLHNTLQEIATSPQVSSPSDSDILSLLGHCATTDRNHDSKYGDMPFFDHWRRVAPSDNNKKKIQRYFGKHIKDSCFQNKVTAVWSATPKSNSLQFLNPDDAVKDVIATSKLPAK